MNKSDKTKRNNGSRDRGLIPVRVIPPQCRSYWIRSLWVAFDCGRLLYSLYFYQLVSSTFGHHREKCFCERKILPKVLKQWKINWWCSIFFSWMKIISEYLFKGYLQVSRGLVLEISFSRFDFGVNFSLNSCLHHGFVISVELLQYIYIERERERERERIHFVCKFDSNIDSYL